MEPNAALLPSPLAVRRPQAGPPPQGRTEAFPRLARSLFAPLLNSGEAKAPDQARGLGARRDSTFLQGAGAGLLQIRLQAQLEQVTLSFLPQAGQGEKEALGAAFRKGGALLSRVQSSFELELQLDFSPQNTLLEKLREYFSPANTAARIFEFSLRHYGSREGSFHGEDTEALRGRYRDYIMPAIERGIEEGLAAFGELPEELVAEVEQTRELILSRYDAFVSGEPEVEGE